MIWLLDTNTISYLLIAVTALKHQATVVTNNVRHFEGLGVTTVDGSLPLPGQD